MSEVQFAKTFLALLDLKAVKLNNDYVSDPKRYPAQSPYILSKPSNPFPKKSATPNASSKTTITVCIKPLKGASPPVTLNEVDANTSLLDVKTLYAKQRAMDVSKIKLLYNKRPASDLKSLRELLPKPTPTSIELSIMTMGGAASVSDAGSSIERASTPAEQVPDPAAVPAKVPQVVEDAPLSEQAAMEDVTYTGKAQGSTSSADGIKSENFWSDLQDFLVQRLRDEEEGKRFTGLFKTAAAV